MIHKLGGGTVEKDVSKAMPLFEKACSGGLPHGCFNLGITYLKGERHSTGGYMLLCCIFASVCLLCVVCISMLVCVIEKLCVYLCMCVG